MSIIFISLLPSFPPYNPSLHSFNSVIFNIFQLLYCKKNQAKINWNPLQKTFVSMRLVCVFFFSTGQSFSQCNHWGSKAMIFESTFIIKSFCVSLATEPPVLDVCGILAHGTQKHGIISIIRHKISLNFKNFVTWKIRMYSLSQLLHSNSTFF